MEDRRDILEQARMHGQSHLAEHARGLPEEKREHFLSQLQAIDFAEIQRLFKQAQEPEVALDLSGLTVPLIIGLARTEADRRRDQAAKRVGEAALRQGRIAIILVAGGQGTRLGHDAPKGTYLIGPVTQRSLFQIHAEKVLALSRRYGRDISLLIMASQENDSSTKAFFHAHRYFGLKESQVGFFVQGMLPVLDIETGKVLLKAPGEVAMSPNGHGGVVEALHRGGLLERLDGLGVTDCYYFQVDNPLTRIADPVFLGHHLVAQAEMSLKVLAKLHPTERLGNVVQLDGRLRIIEYTELPRVLAEERNPEGGLRIWAGSPAIHVFGLSFLKKIGQGEVELPFHIARKAVPYWDESRGLVRPSVTNGLKFERFIFDALPLATRTVALETTRAEEFEPLKNAEGENSPATVQQALSNSYAGWLEKAGVGVLRDAQGNAAVSLEISPLVAMEAEDLIGKVQSGVVVDKPTVWG